MKKLIPLLIAFCSSSFLDAQSWLDIANREGANFYEIQKAAHDQFKNIDPDQKSTGYKPFKRWEYFVGPRVYPSGEMALLGQTQKNFQDFLKEYRKEPVPGKGYSTSSIHSSTWVPAGPFGAPTGSLSGDPTGSGRDNFITFHPNLAGTFYAGAAGSTLWETNNNGTSWSSITEGIPTPGVSDLLIDPSNSNIMYVATGSGDDQMGGNPIVSDGVYKTVNGGLTWQPTGLTFTLSQSRFIHKLAMDPTNPQIIFAAANSGIYRSTNGGTTWTAVSSISCWDLKFHPTNPSIVYATGSAFYRSTNAGLTFTVVSAGIPTAGAYRMGIAVTPTNPSHVYVVACKSSDWQFMGVYRSTNDGVNFVTASTTPNILGNSCGGGSTGQGQGWYDMTIAASPTVPNEIVVGGVNVWRSANGGSTWAMIGCWNNSPWVHADIHELEYRSNGTLFAATDGGIYSHAGSSWTNLNAQRNIAQVYKIGLSSLTPSVWLSGHQDNGTSQKNGSSYAYEIGGDGMDCFIDRTNDQYMYGSTQNGGLRRSINGGGSWAGVTTGLPAEGGWVTPWKQDPVDPATIYSGYTQLYKSTNYGTNWSQLGTTGGGGDMVEFAIAPSNTLVIYVVYPGFIRKTNNAGQSWVNATPPGMGGSPTFVTVDPNDPNTAWVTVSGYSAGKKIFQTVDGGITWMNISANLPNLPANCSVYEPGSNDRIYVGMDVGVYYKDNSSSTWTLYNTGLPNVVIMDMEIAAGSPAQIHAATYGRGIYQADVLEVTAAPVAGFTTYAGVCAGANNVFVDNSSNNPTSWTWSISPAIGVNINSPAVNNPTVTFASPGIYTLTLISGNNFGVSAAYTETLQVTVSPSLQLSATALTVCAQTVFTLSASGATSYTWSNGGGNNSQASYLAPVAGWNYSVTGASGLCLAKETVSVTSMNCTGIEEETKQLSVSLYPNPAKEELIIVVAEAGDIQVRISDVTGKIVLDQNTKGKAEKDNEIHLPIVSLQRGIYFLRVSNERGFCQDLKFVKE